MTMNVYRLTLIAMLAALSVIGRVIFGNVPSILPSTGIIILSGFWLGPLSGILIGIMTAALSNILLGMGIWTLWQSLSWAVIGFGAGIVGRVWNSAPVWALMIYGVCSGMLYGLIMAVTYRAAGQAFWPYYLAGLPFDFNHIVSNVVVIGLLYPVFTRLFRRYEQNMRLVS
ncbi:ECF transporter S component [Halobacillus salinus]|uniref:ECF transporter S component n=1 Tax=Halobacillus salinus TaxID=192814 RepID=UPI0020CA5759|nr:ECF transporter S component [Halobacillus salinus]